MLHRRRRVGSFVVDGSIVTESPKSPRCWSRRYLSTLYSNVGKDYHGSPQRHPIHEHTKTEHHGFVQTANTRIIWSRRRPLCVVQHRWHATPVDGNMSNAMPPLLCVDDAPLMHSLAHIQPLAGGSLVVVGEQLERVTARRHQVHCLPLHTPTHLLRVVTATMPVMHKPMQTPLQALELILLTHLRLRS